MIARVRPEDISACVRVIQESFQTVADEFGFTRENAPRFTAFRVNEPELSRELGEENRRMYVYKADGRIVGFFGLTLLGDRCELNHLAVLPDERHKGIGERLLSHAFSEARDLGCSVMELGYVKENQVLRNWYEKFGFVFTGSKKFDFFPFTCGYLAKEI